MKTAQIVHFLHDPVTGISRRPTLEEHAAMSILEDHLCCCTTCYGVLNQSTPSRLCRPGQLGVQTLSHLMRGGGDGKVYMNNSSGMHFTRIEIPVWFRRTARILGFTYRRRATPTIHRILMEGPTRYGPSYRKNVPRVTAFAIRPKIRPM